MTATIERPSRFNGLSIKLLTIAACSHNWILAQVHPQAHGEQTEARLGFRLELKH